MKWERVAAVCFMAALVAGATEPPSPQTFGTNGRTRAVSRTNLVRLIQCTPTNLVMRVQCSDGTFTNVTIPGDWGLPRTNNIAPRRENNVPRTEDIVKELFKSTSFSKGCRGFGDFWLPGEYQRQLEEKRQERRKIEQ